MLESTLHISTKSLFKICLFALAIYILFLIWHTLLLLFVALIFSALIEPFARSLQKRRIPRGLSAIIVYIILFGIIAISVMALSPVVARDLPELSQNVGNFLTDLKSHETFKNIFGVRNFSESGLLLFPGGTGSSGVAQVFSSLSALFGGIVSFILVLVITFYLVIQDDPLRKIFHSVVPPESLPFTLELLEKIKDRLGSWMRGQLILSTIMGVLIFIVLTLLDIRYAAVIALLAAVLEFIPYIGPIFAALPALFFAFIDGGLFKFALALLFLVIIQQFENHILIPKVMQKAVGLNPIVSIVALIVGIQIGGIVGGVLAIPVATAVQVVIEEVMKKKNKEKSESY